MKKRFSLLLTVIFGMCIALWGQVQSDVTILYTNDIHTYITNTQKDKDGNKVPGLSYGSVAAIRDDLKAQGKQVVLIDAGDHVQHLVPQISDGAEKRIQKRRTDGLQRPQDRNIKGEIHQNTSSLTCSGDFSSSAGFFR